MISGRDLYIELVEQFFIDKLAEPGQTPELRLKNKLLRDMSQIYTTILREEPEAIKAMSAFGIAVTEMMGFYLSTVREDADPLVLKAIQEHATFIRPIWKQLTEELKNAHFQSH